MNYAITGIGEVSSLGQGASQVFQAMCNGHIGFRVLDRFNPPLNEWTTGGQLSVVQEEMLRNAYPDVDLAMAMVLTAGQEALVQAGAGGKTALVLGTNFGMMESQQWAWREWMDTGSIDAETYRPCSEELELIAGELHLEGPRVQISMSCASGAAALRTAADILEQGRAERVLCVAFDVITRYCWCGLSNLHTMTHEVLRPFDARRSGTIFSEGAAALVLEATPSGAPLAYLLGCATNNNAFHITAPPKGAQGSLEVMQMTLADGGIAASEIDHICAHATGTQGNDSTEAAALFSLFGERLSTMTLGAHKSQRGHLMGAASLAEILTSIQVMNQGKLPPNISLEHLAEECQRIPCHSKTVSVQINNVLTNAAGLGGNNASVLLGETACGARRGYQREASVYVNHLAWVLPQNCGSGQALLENASWLLPRLGDRKSLEQANPKQHIHSPKGYLDPTALYQLAAATLLDSQLDPRAGVVTGTRYGAQKSAFAFFQQMENQGARLASPMIFPHGYSSTAGNMVAIHLGLKGPHQVYWGYQDVRELFFFAVERLMDGSAPQMVVGANECVPDGLLPVGSQLLEGALAMELALVPGPSTLFSFTLDELKKIPSLLSDNGMVAALGTLSAMLNAK